MFGGIIAIGTAAVIFLNRKRIVKEMRKSDLYAQTLTLTVIAIVILVAHLYLTGGR